MAPSRHIAVSFAPICFKIVTDKWEFDCHANTKHDKSFYVILS